MDALWHQVAKTRIQLHVVTYDASDNWLDLFGIFRSMWDSEHIYFFDSVQDESFNEFSGNIWEKVEIELFFDGDNSKNSRQTGCDDNDRHFTFVFNAVFNEGNAPNAEYMWLRTDVGYDFKIGIPVIDLNFSLLTDLTIGLEVQINDNDYGSRQHVVKWWNDTDDSWLELALFGTAQLSAR